MTIRGQQCFLASIIAIMELGGFATYLLMHSQINDGSGNMNIFFAVQTFTKVEQQIYVSNYSVVFVVVVDLAFTIYGHA